MRPLRRFIIHHSGTPDSPGPDIQSFRRFHKRDRGWSDIGYHAVVGLLDAEYEVKMGRPLHRMGAHTAGHNFDSIGVALVGNFDSSFPERRALEAAARYIAGIALAANIDPNEIYPHSYFARTRCPGKHLDIHELRRLVQEEIAR